MKVIFETCKPTAAPPGFRFGGNILGGQTNRGYGGLRPPDTGEFSKILTNFLSKLQKFTIFAYFPTQVNERCVNFSHVWTKNTIVWETFEKVLKIFIRK